MRQIKRETDKRNGGANVKQIERRLGLDAKSIFEGLNDQSH